MHDNPYQAEEREAIEAARPKPIVTLRERAWPVLFWAVVGFGAGTGVIAPTILSIEVRDRVIGGMLIGGIPIALMGAVYGWWHSKP